MTESPKKPRASSAVEGDPKRGDEILKRMLQTKPKQHKDMVAERQRGRGKAKGTSPKKR